MDMIDSTIMTLWLHMVSVTDQDMRLISINAALQLLCQNMPEHVQQKTAAQ